MENLIKLLNIDKRCVIDKRITKVAISNNSALNTSEKKILKEIISDLRWLASYKPFNSSIPEFVTKTESYDEVQIISIGINDTKYTKQVVNLLQKSMPYPLVLLLESENKFAISISKKSINQTDKIKRTIDETITSSWIDYDFNTEISKTLLDHLNTKSFVSQNLKTFYESFTKIIYQYETSLLTGKLDTKSKKEVLKDASTLKKLEIINKEIISLKSQIKKETVFSEKVTLNIRFKEFEKNKQKLLEILS
jgi:hypothetical protein